MNGDKSKQPANKKPLHQLQSQVEYLIIGQGICGTFLSWYLKKENKSILVIDDNFSSAPSKVASGIINPVTGRRIAPAWMIDELIPFARTAYNEMADRLGIKTISQKKIIDFFLTPQMVLAFRQRLENDNRYLKPWDDNYQYRQLFNYDFGCGEISPAFVIHLENILPAWRQMLIQHNVLIEEKFITEELQAGDEIKYKNIRAEKIIFCDGISSSQYPWFKPLPFAPSKGEVLDIEATGLPADFIFKKGIMIAPLSEANYFRVGSNYLWDFEDAAITTEFRIKTEAQLNEWLKVPFKIINHQASIRPGTLERRPFVGLHPLYKNIGILNGMGTKGCSLAPFFAKQLADHLVHQKPILPEADINRFQKILSRT